LKEGWKKSHLIDVCTKITDGSHFSPKTITTGYPYITVRDVVEDNIDFVNCKHISKTDYNDLVKNGCQPEKGDVLFSKDGTVGKVTVIDYEKEFVVLSSLAIIRPNKSIIDSYFLSYILKSPFFLSEAIGRKTGVAIRRIVLKNLKTINIPLPPLPEQKRIVAIFDEAFAGIKKAIANTEKNLKNAQELYSNKLKFIFKKDGQGWQKSTIGELCTLMTGGTPSKGKKQYFDGGKIPWLVSGDIHKQNIFECDGRITQEGYDNSSAKYLPVNSVMIALNGQGKTRGTVAMLRMKATCNQSLVSINPNNSDKILPEYIYTNLKIRYEDIRKITGDSGNDRRGLNMPLIRKMSITFPQSINDQKNIVDLEKQLSNKIYKFIEVQQLKQQNLNELKQSLLQKAFSSELTSNPDKSLKEAAV